MKYSADEFCAVNETILAAALTDASTDGTGVDCRGFSECLVIFNAILCAANAEADVHIEDSADDSTYADVSGAVFDQVTAASDVTTIIGRIDLKKRKRYLRAVLATDGANAATCAVTFVLIGAKYGPATQTHTVDFDV